MLTLMRKPTHRVIMKFFMGLRIILFFVLKQNILNLEFELRVPFIMPLFVMRGVDHIAREDQRVSYANVFDLSVWASRRSLAKSC
jgi:hypothetical protein